MSVSHLEVIVEEPSAKAALQCLLPRILGESLTFEIYDHGCKQELLARLPDRLRGYVRWLPDNWRIIVVVDKDQDDFDGLVGRLEEVACAAGVSVGRVFFCLAVEELEAWFFGDWEAVREAYPRVSASIPQQAKYRAPDAIQGGTWEAFERVLKRAGYFQTGLRKIEAARNVASCMLPERNTSPSFIALRQVLEQLARS